MSAPTRDAAANRDRIAAHKARFTWPPERGADILAPTRRHDRDRSSLAAVTPRVQRGLALTRIARVR
jgi:hypothetical protein